MVNKLKLILALLFVGQVLFAQDYYVATDGTAGGAGTLLDPWSLEWAFDRDNPNQPGPDGHMYIRGGTYVSKFGIWFGGTNGHNAIITNYEDEEVIIDGNDGVESQFIVLANTAYVTVDGITILHSGLSRVTDDPGLFPDYPYHVHGIFVNQGAKNFIVKNCVIHDTHGNAVACYAPNAQIVGNIFYYNGWDSPSRGSAYGFYIQNSYDSTYIQATNNVVFSNFSKGMHLYGESTPILTNVSINDNVMFNAGAPSWESNGESGSEGNIYIGGNCPMAAVDVLRNHAYSTGTTRGECMRVGYWEADIWNIKIEDNVISGGYRSFQVNYTEEITVRNNQIFNRSRFLTDLEGDNSTDDFTWDNNQYYFDGSYAHYSFNGTDWAGWQSLGFDTNSSYAETRPPTNSYDIKYDHGMKWAVVAVYDWNAAGSMNVDLSGVLPSGEPYEIYDVQYLDGLPVVTGTENGTDVSIPTNLSAVTPIIGNDVAYPIVHTEQDFNTYIVKADNFITPDVNARFTLSPDNEINLSDTIYLNALTSEGDIVSYDWDFGNGDTHSSSGGVTFYEYPNEGTYTITLTTTDSDLNTSQTTQNIQVGNVAMISARFSAIPNPVEIGEEVYFDASSSLGNITSYGWVFSDGFTGSGVTTSHAYSSAGDYSAILTVSDAESNSDQSTLGIVVNSVDPPAPESDSIIITTSQQLMDSISMNRSPGDTLWLKADSFSGTFDFSESGSEDHPIVIILHPDIGKANFNMIGESNIPGSNIDFIDISFGESSESSEPRVSITGDDIYMDGCRILRGADVYGGGLTINSSVIEYTIGIHEAIGITINGSLFYCTEGVDVMEFYFPNGDFNYRSWYDWDFDDNTYARYSNNKIGGYVRSEYKRRYPMFDKNSNWFY